MELVFFLNLLKHGFVRILYSQSIVPVSIDGVRVVKQYSVNHCLTMQNIEKKARNATDSKLEFYS